MEITTQKIAMLVDNYFEQAEFEEPLKHFKQAGADVTVVATEQHALQAMEHDIEKGKKFTADSLIADADAKDYDILILPGGTHNADRLRMSHRARQWVDCFIDEDKLIAAICHAPWLLVSADVIEGRRLTSYYTLQDDIRNAGAEWIDQPVVVDGNLITSRQPDDIPYFLNAINHWLQVTKTGQKEKTSAGARD